VIVMLQKERTRSAEIHFISRRLEGTEGRILNGRKGGDDSGEQFYSDAETALGKQRDT